MKTNNWIKAVVRASMCFFGILGNNWLAFRSLPKSRSPLRTNDILFVNLAVSNLITNYMVDLPDTLELVVNWTTVRRYCFVFNFCSEVSECSSIFTTMFITVYWHQKLVGSLKNGGAPVQMENLRLITALLTGSWAFATIFSIPNFVRMSADTLNQSSDDCAEQFPNQEAKQVYEMLYLTLANLAPIIGIIFASIQIAVTLLQNERRIRNNTGVLARRGNDKRKTPEPTSKEITLSTANKWVQRSQDKTSSSTGNQVRAAKSVMMVATVFLICWLTHLTLSITVTVYNSMVLEEIISYIGATYTCIIPYMYLHGMRKLNCSG